MDERDGRNPDTEAYAPNRRWVVKAGIDWWDVQLALADWRRWLRRLSMSSLANQTRNPRGGEHLHAHCWASVSELCDHVSRARLQVINTKICLKPFWDTLDITHSQLENAYTWPSQLFASQCSVVDIGLEATACAAEAHSDNTQAHVVSAHSLWLGAEVALVDHSSFSRDEPSTTLSSHNTCHPVRADPT